MNLPRVVILKCTCQVSDILIVEMLIAYAVVAAAATNLQCPVFHKRLDIFRVTDSSLVICICDHMPTGMNHAYVRHPQVSFD